MGCAAQRYGRDLFEGIPPGPEGFFASIDVLARAGPPPGYDESTMNPEDLEIGAYLYHEHQRQIAEWQRRQQDNEE